LIHLDTSFLVDVLRENTRRKPGPATAFFERVADEEIAISVFVACELYAGAELSERSTAELQNVAELCRAVPIAYPDERFAGRYGRLMAELERRGTRISAMDLLIATSAVLADAALVTRNTRHFARVPGLLPVSY
jgi:tRNA(fMet)-specific endonuclease VapC